MDKKYFLEIISQLKQEIGSLEGKVSDLKGQNRELRDRDIFLLKTPVQNSAAATLPTIIARDRRQAERRKIEIPVGIDRRSGFDRRNRSDLIYIRREYEILFKDFFPEKSRIHQLVLKSRGGKIIEAYWELWSAVLGYNLKHISDINDIYENPEDREEILRNLDIYGYSKQELNILKADGSVVVMDSLFVKNSSADGEFYIFIHINNTFI